MHRRREAEIQVIILNKRWQPFYSLDLEVTKELGYILLMCNTECKEKKKVTEKGFKDKIVKIV